MKLNDIPNDQNERGPLPEMETYEQAEAVSRESGNHFYLCAFMMQSWIKGLMLESYGQAQLWRDRPDSAFESELAAFGCPMCRLPAPEGTTDEDLRSKAKDGPQREIDTLLIALQPLAKQHHWTCTELLTILRQL